MSQMYNLYVTMLVCGVSGVIFPRLGWWVLIVAAVLNLVIGSV